MRLKALRWFLLVPALLALVWLFTGLRSDEIVRLRLGCIRWQEEDIAVPGRPGDVLARDAICMLEVPVNKTGAAYRRIQKSYINAMLIPALCGKAGVPAEDDHGRLTSHRARATIATQLYNAKDPSIVPVNSDAEIVAVYAIEAPPFFWPVTSPPRRASTRTDAAD